MNDFLCLCLVVLCLSLSTLCRSKKVVVFGGTGRTGRTVIQQLMSEPSVSKIICPVRNLAYARKALGKESAKLRLVPCDIAKADSLLLQSILEQIDVCVICSGYAVAKNQLPDPCGPYKTDNLGNKRIIDVSSAVGCKKIVLLSSLLTNGFESGQFTNPQYILLNSFGGILLNKRAAEKHLIASDLDWTIIRPGGLTDDGKEQNAPLLYGTADSIVGGSITRTAVAEVVVAACLQEAGEASSKKVCLFHTHILSYPLDTPHYTPLLTFSTHLLTYHLTLLLNTLSNILPNTLPLSQPIDTLADC